MGAEEDAAVVQEAQDGDLYCPECGLEFEREEDESDSDAYLRHGPECGIEH
jgi:hypothetical protein